MESFNQHCYLVAGVGGDAVIATGPREAGAEPTAALGLRGRLAVTLCRGKAVGRARWLVGLSEEIGEGVNGLESLPG